MPSELAVRPLPVADQTSLTRLPWPSLFLVFRNQQTLPHLVRLPRAQRGELQSLTSWDRRMSSAWCVTVQRTAHPDPGDCLPEICSCTLEPSTSVRQMCLLTPGMARCARPLVPPAAQAHVLSRASSSFSIQTLTPSSPSVSFNRPLLVVCMLVLSLTRMSSLHMEVKEPNS